MSNTQGKAWTYTSTKGGLVANLSLTDYDVPGSKKDHVLIEVLNASLNPGDYKFPDLPVLSWFIKRPASPCFDFCGRIRALPAEFTDTMGTLKVGQIVFGMHRDIRSIGTLKTIMWVHKDTLYPLPDNVPQQHGSAFGCAALTAYQAIAPYARPGGKILINGGSGGVGTFSIQVAKALDMYVIATCSDAGAKLCKDLGADEILDYKSPTYQDDLCRTQVDLVLDNIGHDPQLHYHSEQFLKPDGHFVIVGLMADTWVGIRSMLVSYLCPTWLGGPSRTWKLIFTSSTVRDYEPVATLAREGKLKVVVDAVFPFSEVPKAFEKLQTGRTKGKIIVDVSSRNQ